MKQPSKSILRLISALYLLLFLITLWCSAVLLSGIVALSPIPFIGLMKYSLLCVLFMVLSINAIRGFGLAPAAISRLSGSTKNFKWLFTIALTIAILTKSGYFNVADYAATKVSYEHITVLVVLTIFCFWSAAVLEKMEIEQVCIPEQADAEPLK